MPPKETECCESCLAAGDALKYLELETTPNCLIQEGADERAALESMTVRPSLSFLPLPGDLGAPSSSHLMSSHHTLPRVFQNVHIPEFCGSLRESKGGSPGPYVECVCVCVCVLLCWFFFRKRWTDQLWLT